MNKKILKSKLFNDVAIYTNNIDVKKAENIYYGVFKAIIKNLKSHGEVYLPDVGMMKIIYQKSNTVPDCGGRRVVGGFRLIKFIPCQKMKDYIKS